MKFFKLKGISDISIAIIVAIFAMALMLYQYFYIGVLLKKDATIEASKLASSTAGQVARSIEVYFRDALTVTRTYSENFMVYKQNKIDRLTIYKLMYGSLKINDRFIAIWTMWEPNAYDNKDIEFRNDNLHDPLGSFAMTYYYDGDSIKAEINNTTDFLDDYYTIPKKLRKPVILDPYYYQYHGNEKVYFETSMISPVIEDGIFKGVIGIDIDMYELQKKFNEKVSFTDGYISILSNSGQIVSMRDSMYVNQNISKYLGNTEKSLIDSIKSGKTFKTESFSVFIGQKVIRYYYPINIEYMAAPWYIMIEIPYHKVFEKVNALNRISLVFLISSLILLTYLVYNIIDRRIKEKELLRHRNQLELLVKTRTEELANTNNKLQHTNEELHTQKRVLEKTLEDLEIAQDQMIQSEKMASLGLLAAGVAHEINNPLNFIQSGVDGLESYFNQHAENHISNIKLFLDAIQTGVSRASTIVTSLNHYSRSGDATDERCEIHQVIENCLVILQNQVKDRIELIKDFTPPPALVKGHEGKLHQAMLNILSNAVQAISNEGTIHITTKASAQKIWIIVEDTGCGIEAEHIGKIFDPFFTTKAPGKGTGLGLSITYAIIQEHGGNIEYSSFINQGTIVTISLPKIQEA